MPERRRQRVVGEPRVRGGRPADVAHEVGQQRRGGQQHDVLAGAYDRAGAEGHDARVVARPPGAVPRVRGERVGQGPVVGVPVEPRADERDPVAGGELDVAPPGRCGGLAQHDERGRPETDALEDDGARERQHPGPVRGRRRDGLRPQGVLEAGASRDHPERAPQRDACGVEREQPVRHLRGRERGRAAAQHARAREAVGRGASDAVEHVPREPGAQRASLRDGERPVGAPAQGLQLAEQARVVPGVGPERDGERGGPQRAVGVVETERAARPGARREVAGEAVQRGHDAAGGRVHGCAGLERVLVPRPQRGADRGGADEDGARLEVGEGRALLRRGGRERRG